MTFAQQNGLKELCVCGNDRASHHPDPVTGERGACLCLGCDCQRYDDVNAPHTPRTPVVFHVPYGSPRFKPLGNKPHIATSCPCSACRDWKERKRQADIDYGNWMGP